MYVICWYAVRDLKYALTYHKLLCNKRYKTIQRQNCITGKGFGHIYITSLGPFPKIVK